MMKSIKKLLRPYYWAWYAKKYKLASEAPVFIVGCGHSGTTLILRILAEHNNLYAIDYESSVFGPRHITYPKMADWTRHIRETGQHAWVEKTPSHVRFLDKIFKVYPKAKVIVMLRDGRDVAMSLKNRTGDLQDGIMRWVHDNEAWMPYQNDPRIMLLKLEDFVNDSHKYTQDICRHIGVEYSEQLLDYHKSSFNYQNAGAQQTDGKQGDNHQLNRNWQVSQKIFKSTSRWQKEANAEDIELFERCEAFQTMLKELDYVASEINPS